jgi:hypothetical protein
MLLPPRGIAVTDAVSRSAAGARPPSIATLRPKPVPVRNVGDPRADEADFSSSFSRFSDRSDLKYDTTRGEFVSFVYGALDVD